MPRKAKPTERIPLNEQRRLRGISLQSVADTTKISTQYLLAIEQEQFQKLPGGVFNINYIRQYAQATCIDELEILDRYLAFLHAPDPLVGVPPELGISRLETALRRFLCFFRRHAPTTAQPRTFTPENGFHSTGR